VKDEHARTSRWKEFKGSLARLARIVRVLARHGVSVRMKSWVERWPFLTRRFPSTTLSRPDRLRVMLEEVGGTFIKFGQMLALQPDILPREYCNALFDLLDRIEPFSYAEVERVIVEELGETPDKLFDSFDREPLSTASIGQVHVAWLRGKKVAVKVQRPNVESEFMGDIRLMLLAMSLVRGLRLRSLAWILEPMGEFVSWTQEELDYRMEARYAEYILAHAIDNPVETVPRVYGPFTTQRVLVEEFLPGVTLLEYLRAREVGDELKARRLEPAGFDRARFASNVIDNFLGDAFQHGIYHADLHPANLLILDDNVVGYVDFGITGVMSRHARRRLMAMTLALAQGDMELLHDEFLRISGFGPNADLSSFRRGLDEMAGVWYDTDFGGDRKLNVNFTRIMGDMLTLSRRYGVLPERDIVKYIRSAIAIDGLVTRFEPDFEVGRYLAESCARYLAWETHREALTPERFLDWTTSAGMLATSGLQRSSKLLDRIADGDFFSGGREEDNSSQLALRVRALQLAGAAFAGTLLMLAGGPGTPLELTPGVNLWTAQVCFVAGATLLLGVTLRRLFADDGA
jgi:ubiquinone biosynthesis protein